MRAEVAREGALVGEMKIGGNLFQAAFRGAHGELQSQHDILVDDVLRWKSGLAAHDDAQILARDVHALGVVVHLVALMKLLLKQFHEAVEQLVGALRALVAQVGARVGKQIVVESEEERLQLQRHNAVGERVVLHGEVEPEDAEHAAHHLAYQRRIAAAAVGLQRVVDGVLHVQTRRSQRVATIHYGVCREVVAHRFPFYYVAREEAEHTLAAQLPCVEVDAHGGFARLAIYYSTVVYGVGLGAECAAIDAYKRRLFHAAKLAIVSQIVKFWRIFITRCP